MLPDTTIDDSRLTSIKTREQFLANVVSGMAKAPMSVRLTPHILSIINWDDPLNDPVRRQFIPLEAAFVPDHPSLTLDSLHESDDSPVNGLVHRYPEKVLFLGKSSGPDLRLRPPNADLKQQPRSARFIAGSVPARMRLAVTPSL